MFKAEGLSVRYRGGSAAIREFDLVFFGKILCVYGASKDGKTSLINALAGVTDSVGRVTLDGVDIKELEKGDVFALLEDCTIINKLTVYENLAYPLRLRGMNELDAAKRVNSIVREFGLEAYVSVKGKALLKKIRPYVGLAKIGLTKRKLYLIDDIFAPLSESERATCFKKLKQIVKTLSGAVIYATSSIAEALELGDMTAVLYGGVIEQYGTRAELTEFPLSVRLARLLAKEELVVETARLNEDYTIKYKGGTITLPDGYAERLLKGYIGQDVQVAEFVSECERKIMLFDAETDLTILKK